MTPRLAVLNAQRSGMLLFCRVFSISLHRLIDQRSELIVIKRLNHAVRQRLIEVLKRRYKLSIHVVRKNDGRDPCLLQLLEKERAKGIARYYQPEIAVIHRRVDFMNITDGIRPVPLLFKDC